MSKSGLFSVVVVLLVILVLASLYIAGGQNDAETRKDETSKDIVKDKKNGQNDNVVTLPASTPKPMLDGWEKPALAILLTGEQRGSLEPCGCSDKQSGGISRRADLLRQVTEKDWPLIALDLGGAVKRNRPQSQLKFQTLLAALGDMHYAAVALGPQELRFGAEYLFTQQPVDGPPFLCANVVFDDFADFGIPAQTKLGTVGDLKIGVTAILGMSFKDKVLITGNLRLSIQEPAKALPDAIEQLKQQKPDLMVLLSHANADESRKLANDFPEFDVILSAGGPEDPSGTPEQVGEAVLVHVGHKGKYVGVLGYYPDKPAQRLRFELVELDKERFKNAPEIVQRMQDYQEQLRDQELAGTGPAIAHPSGARFVGVKKCAECHEKAYTIWKTTPHADAFESLKKDTRPGRANFGTRAFDAECLSCHVTGWHPQQVLRYESGFINKEFATTEADQALSRLLKGQQCENCHGPGSRHVKLVGMDDLPAARKEVRVTLAEAKNNLCISCHDYDNSPEYDWDIYWPQVEHKGLD